MILNFTQFCMKNDVILSNINEWTKFHELVIYERKCFYVHDFNPVHETCEEERS